MTQVALSTMWSLRYDSLDAFVSDARDYGFTHLELNSGLDPERLDALLAGDCLPVSSIHAPCPNPLVAGGIAASGLSLGALDEDERRAAVSFTRATIDTALRTGAKVVVVHAGWAKMPPELERDLRRQWERGQAGSPEFEAVKAKLVAARKSFACAHVDAAKKSLLELAAHARASGVQLALENRVHYHEIPSIEEMLDILCEFTPDVMGYWHDVGHAELLARIRFTPHEDWFMALGDRMLGVHLHDVRGVQDHYAPGAGELDWDMISCKLPAGAVRVCEIAEWNEPEEARNAVPFLQGKGIVS